MGAIAKSVRAVLFDVDDTLFDRRLARVAVLELMIKRFSQLFSKFSKERIWEAFNESDRVVTAEFNAGAPSEVLRAKAGKYFLRSLGLSEEYEPTITEAYVEEYPKFNTPVAGAVPLVRELSLRYKIGAITNGLPDAQYRKLESIGLRDIFSCIVLSEEFGVRKPDPRIFRKAAGLLDIQVRECLYVGNSYDVDVVGAKNAGMLTCWLNSGNSDPENRGREADITIRSLTELGSLL